jgi:hypothetical protein
MKLEKMRKRGMGEDGLEEKTEARSACAEACHLPAITHAVTGPRARWGFMLVLFARGDTDIQDTQI